MGENKGKKPPKPFQIKLIASPEDYSPLRKDFKVVGAFNPGVTSVQTKEGLETILYVRIAETPLNEPDNKIFLPFFHISNKEKSPIDLDYDEFERKSLSKIGKKEVVTEKEEVRLRHISLPRLLVLDENRKVSQRQENPIIFPSWEDERFGIEDVRITNFDGKKYLITYATPHREFGVNSHILSKTNVKDFTKLKRVTSNNTPRPEIGGKDVAVFPRKIPSTTETELLKKGQLMYASFIRPNGFPDLSAPGIWISYSPDLVHWGQNHKLTTSKNGEVTGTGSPPVERSYGWLEAYHETTEENNKIKYVTKLMTLGLNTPWEVLNISPVLLERKDFRKLLPDDGYIPNVVFTSGVVVDDGRIDFYQGIDDTWTTMASFYTKDIDDFVKKE